MPESSAQIIATLLSIDKPFVCFLHGDLGAGKTTFVRQYMTELGYSGLVKSPSYTMLEQYDEQKILHLDLYRLDKVDKNILEELGVSEFLGVYSLFIEWPERLAPNLLQQDVAISISLTNDIRLYSLEFFA